jgi:hypothetical protein
MTLEPIDPAPIGPDEERDLAESTARKDGRQVVTLRSLARGAEFFVECEVYPVSGLHVEPLRPGPYRFSTEEEAQLFMSEASRALTFLGCDVS